MWQPLVNNGRLRMVYDQGGALSFTYWNISLLQTPHDNHNSLSCNGGLVDLAIWWNWKQNGWINY